MVPENSNATRLRPRSEDFINKLGQVFLAGGAVVLVIEDHSG
jgi:hypothetical protein